MRILLCEFGSDGYPSFGWNYYGGESLKGHIQGEFPNKNINVQLFRVFKKKDEDFLLKEIREKQYVCLGFSLPPGSLPNAHRFFKKLKTLPRSKYPLIVFGQQLATYCSEDILTQFSYLETKLVCVRGEGEDSMKELVLYLEDEKELHEIPNLIFLDNGKYVRTQLYHSPLSKLNHPAAFNMNDPVSKNYSSVLVQTSRGCPWGRCAYCTRTSFRNPGTKPKDLQNNTLKRWESFPFSKIETEFNFLMKHGVRSFEFADDDFFGGYTEENIQRLESLIDLFQQLTIKYDSFHFRFFTRPDFIYREQNDAYNKRIFDILTRFHRIGASRIFIGVEGADNPSLCFYNRGVTLQTSLKAIDICKKIGFDVDVGFIMFYPNQTPKGILDMAQVYLDNNLVKHNQWPFRPLIINYGSPLEGQSLNSVTIQSKTNESLNFMRYDWEYTNHDMKIIYDTLMRFAERPRDVMYALKVKTKKDYSNIDTEIQECQVIIEKNALIHLALLTELSELSLQEKLNRESVQTIFREKERDILKLISSVNENINNGIIRDEDKYITNCISRDYF